MQVNRMHKGTLLESSIGTVVDIEGSRKKMTLKIREIHFGRKSMKMLSQEVKIFEIFGTSPCWNSR